MNLILIESLELFLNIIFIHILIWRLVKPKQQVCWLFGVFLLFPLFIFCFWNIVEKVSFIEILNVAVLYYALAFAYIMTYPAIQAWSPSLKIVYELEKCQEGLSEKEIADLFSENTLLQDRIQDLIIENFVAVKDDRLYLANKGKVIADIFYLYRRIYGLKAGEG